MIKDALAFPGPVRQSIFVSPLLSESLTTTLPSSKMAGMTLVPGWKRCQRAVVPCQHHTSVSCGTLTEAPRSVTKPKPRPDSVDMPGEAQAGPAAASHMQAGAPHRCVHKGHFVPSLLSVYRCCTVIWANASFLKEGPEPKHQHLSS